jgi:hypothetical protein
MPTINGERRNPSRRRYHGLDVGDRIKYRIWRGSNCDYKYGTVKELDFFDNNRVSILFDNEGKCSSLVAEHCIRIDEEGLEVYNIMCEFISALHKPTMSITKQYFNHLLTTLKITQQQAEKVLKEYPGINLEEKEEAWMFSFYEID